MIGVIFLTAKIILLVEVITFILLSVSCAITGVKRGKIKKSEYKLVYMPTHFLLAGIFGTFLFLGFVYIGAFLAKSLGFTLCFSPFVVLCMLLLIYYKNYYIMYDRHSFVYSSFLGIKKTFSYNQITGIFGDIQKFGVNINIDDYIVKVDKDSCNAKSFVSFAKLRYRQLHNGAKIPNGKTEWYDVFKGNELNYRNILLGYALLFSLFIIILALSMYSLIGDILENGLLSAGWLLLAFIATFFVLLIVSINITVKVSKDKSKYKPYMRYFFTHEGFMEDKMKIINLVEDTYTGNGFEHEHGLSFYIETENHKILADCGASDMFIRNARRHKIDLSEIDSIILSHGHYDHSGGIMPFMRINPYTKIYMNHLAGGDYYSLKEWGLKYIGIDKRILDLPSLELVKGNLKIDDEIFIFSGMTAPENLSKGNSRLKMKTDKGFVQDSFEHEQCFVITHKNKKILISGCAHNGMIIILERYKELFNSYPDIVISGFHMIQPEPYSEADVLRIEQTAIKLLKTGAVFYTGHCTGLEAYEIMKEVMGDNLIFFHSGDVII